MSLRRNAVRAALTVALAAFAAAAAPAASHADVDPHGCTPTLGYNADVPTWEQWFAAHPDPQRRAAVRRRRGDAGGGAPTNGAGTPPTGRNLTSVIYAVLGRLVALTASDDKNADGTYKFPYQVITSRSGPRPTAGRSILRRRHAPRTSPTSTPAQRRARSGAASARARSRPRRASRPQACGPAFMWITATPHGGESAAGESITPRCCTSCWRGRTARTSHRHAGTGHVPDAGPQPGRP